MKRKISVILVADIAGYSKLVAEDEEETLRRLATCRAVFDDFVTRHGGRIFNTAGDAVLAEFPSSVEAIRCAVDIQESIRTRNLAYPPSREMSFRIGLTVGDVVEREGDLLGDAVNIAARLQGLATPGGICVSRAVYEQVVHKLSAKFEDIGEQHVKNIPDAIHAYVIAPYATAQSGESASPRQRNRYYLAGAAVASAVIVALLGAIIFRQRSAGDETAGGTPAAVTHRGQLAVLPSAGSIDAAKIRAVAAQHGMVLPPTFKVSFPSGTPASVAEYAGAWGSGGRRWGGDGRTVILIVESVDRSGAAVGVYAQGAGNANSADQSPAAYTSFAGTISDSGLEFSSGEFKYTFKVMPDGLMWGHRSALGTTQDGMMAMMGVQARNADDHEVTITLERIK